MQPVRVRHCSLAFLSGSILQHIKQTHCSSQHLCMVYYYRPDTQAVCIIVMVQMCLTQPAQSIAISLSSAAAAGKMTRYIYITFCSSYTHNSVWKCTREYTETIASISKQPTFYCQTSRSCSSSNSQDPVVIPSRSNLDRFVQNNRGRVAAAGHAA